MKTTSFNEFILNSPRRLAMPISLYPGLHITGHSVFDVTHNSSLQFETAVALQERYEMPWVSTAMDLTPEAEAFGCEITKIQNEVPCVIGQLISTMEQAEELVVPKPGDGRTSVYIDSVKLLRAAYADKFVFAGCLGPFSLAARLASTAEGLMFALTDPDIMHCLLEKCVYFSIAYIRSLKAAGADGIFMAEPTACLMRPECVAEFSSDYVKRIIDALGDNNNVILHSCSATNDYLPVVLAAGAKAFHFGKPMDMIAALDSVPTDVILCGNLDPTEVFVLSSPDGISQKTHALLDATMNCSNVVISSGCDLPRDVPLANLDAFFAAVAGHG